MKEKDIQNKIMRWLKSHDDWFVWKVSDRFNAGFPDILVIHNGKVTLFEVKSPTGRATPLQLAIHEDIQRAGGRVFVVRSLEEVKKHMGGADGQIPEKSKGDEFPIVQEDDRVAGHSGRNEERRSL